MERRRVAITGIGICAPLGLGREIFWEKLVNGEKSIRDISKDNELFATSKTKVGSVFLDNQITDESLRLRAEDLGYNLENKEQGQKYRVLFKSGERFAKVAFFAAREAIEDSGILNQPDTNHVKDKTGCAIGGGFGGLSSIESACRRIERTKTIAKVNPVLMARTTLPSTAAATISEHYGFHSGNAPSLETACASGLTDIIYGFEKIAYGRALCYCCGGTGDASSLTLGGFSTIGALSTNSDPEHASRPFDKNRDGFVIGEGAGVLFLEELEHAKKRKAHIYAEILGYGESLDAGHPTQPDLNGKYATLAILEAINDARINSSNIDYINAHGTSTEFNDKVESLIYKTAFGDYIYKIPISSIKGAVGHMLNAAGSVELGVTALSIDRGIIPLTRGLEEPDIENGCNLDYVPNKSRYQDVILAMSANFGFGGRNSVVILGKPK